MLAPFYAIFIYRLLTIHYHVTPSSPDHPLSGARSLTLISTLFYMYSSTFFQPDLDNKPFRPGHHAFPFGKSISVWQFGRFIRAAFFPVTLFWREFWSPFASLFTHRGVVHWPIIGVWLRVGYLYVWIIALEILAAWFNQQNHALGFIHQWLDSFFPWNKGFGSTGFIMFCLPVYIGDLLHSAVDLYESYSSGKKFCSAQQKRGLIVEFRQLLVDSIKDMKKQIR